ncbi:hypothetical protein HYE67_006727 [Fusarium culmorum]|uniref:Fungal N-terminal domain-containing protein n=1 Tax=Fusarium culmorum TaxID=5516 RepID=A0A2T4H294_FUSCU|nr:hypothetical protein FCULG_00007750 [Fusarium culmorum]QPC64496.1 hypothetical protein HYE67_006727 [Fusarium culmorum]
MAELAFAIIPIGIKACSGLVSYLSGLKDRSDALNRLTRQAESLEGSFMVLDTFMKRGQLDPTRYESVSQIGVCLKNCKEGLKELMQFEQSQKAQNRLEHGIQKLCFPLQKAHLERLESTLNRLCQPLTLAIQNLQLEIDVANSGVLARHSINIQHTSTVVSNLETAIADLNAPINSIGSQIPILQSSVDRFIPEIIPHINLAIESQLRAQTEQMRQLFQKTEPADILRHSTTNTNLSRLAMPYGSHNHTVGNSASRRNIFADLTSLVPTCCCQLKKSTIVKSFNFGAVSLRDDMSTDLPHQKGCPFYVDNLAYSNRRITRLTAVVKSLNSAFQLSLCTTAGTGGFSISPSLTYFAVVDEKTAPAFRVFYSLWDCEEFNSSKKYQELCLEAVLRKLQVLFRSGRAKPTDVNEDGLSLLHMFSRAVSKGFEHTNAY